MAPGPGTAARPGGATSTRRRPVRPPGGETLSLHGIRVGVTSQRKGRELAAALERRGADVLHGPTVGGDEPVPLEEVAADTRRVIEAGPDWVVASTGVGVRFWAEAAERTGHLEALRAVVRRARCVARGPKAVGGLRALDVVPEWTSSVQTDADVAGWLAGRVRPGQAVALQLHGGGVPATFAPVSEAGADLLPVATYRHGAPDDVGPALELIEAVVGGALDVVVLTSPGAARNLVGLARQHRPDAVDELRAALRARVATAVIGPVTAGALEEEDLPVWLAPERHRTGDLLRALDAWADGR